MGEVVEERLRQGLAPTVSIIMGVYNASETIREALDSILAQTFADWELVICDDGSTDDTLQICHQYARAHPGRFRVLANNQNLKLPATLNRCLSVACGAFIARMDADDVSRPERLAAQVEFLKAHPSTDLVGTAMQRFNQSGFGSVVSPPAKPDRNTLRSRVPFCHATILARRTVYDRIGGYNESPRTARTEDIDLWFNFYRLGFVGANLLEPLYLVREDMSAIRRRSLKNRWNLFLTMVHGYRMLGYPAYAYVRPGFELLKALVPFRAQYWYRQWQGRHHEARAA